MLLGYAQAAAALGSGISQAISANRLKKQDTIPAAFREKEQLDRQAATSQRLPGYGAQVVRLGQVQNGALQNARLGAASGSDFLAAASAADARRQQGEQQLGVMSQQYMDKSRAQLGADLTQEAAYQDRDLNNYNKTKAALIQASAENFNSGLKTAASYQAYDQNRQDNLDESAANRAAGLSPYGARLGIGTYSPPAAVEQLTPRIATLQPDSSPKIAPTRLPGLYGANGAAYNLGALPNTTPTPGITKPIKLRNLGGGLLNRRAGIGL